MRVETQVGVRVGEFEQVLETCGYKLRETAEIAGRAIQVYEKPPNPKYTIKNKQSPEIFREHIDELLKELEKGIVLIDGFNDHDERRKWIKGLEKQGGADIAEYRILEKQSILNYKHFVNIYNSVSDIKHRLMKNIEGEESKLKFEQLYKNIYQLRHSKDYQDLSLSEKILYMEKAGKIVMKILDLLRKVESPA